MTVGNRDDATHALLGLSDEFNYGSNRTVFLVNGVIYKVMNYSHMLDNRWEWENYCAWSTYDLHPTAFLPETYLWEVNGVDVIAMQYIRGEPIDDDDEEHARTLFPFSNDVWAMNVFVNEDGYWLIDMGA